MQCENVPRYSDYTWPAEIHDMNIVRTAISFSQTSLDLFCNSTCPPCVTWSQSIIPPTSSLLKPELGVRGSCGGSSVEGETHKHVLKLCAYIYIHAYIYFVYVRTYVHNHTYIRTYVYSYRQKHIAKYIHKYIYMHSHIHTYIHT